MKKRIYIAEDLESQAEFLKAVLEKSGEYTVTFFSDGLDLYEGVRREPPHLLILDIILPSLSGLAAARLIKFNEPTRHIPILVVSSIIEPDIAEKARHAGADAFLSKPLTAQNLTQEVERLLALETVTPA